MGGERKVKMRKFKFKAQPIPVRISEKPNDYQLVI